VDTVDSFEIVLADGSVVFCDEDGEHSELFRAAGGAYGTLGVVTAATLRLQPVTDLVRTAYFHFTDIPSYVAAMKLATGPPCAAGKPRFVEGYMFSSTSAVLMVGDCITVDPDATQAELDRNPRSGPTSGSVGKELFFPRVAGPAVAAHTWDPTVRGKEWIHQHALSTARAAWPEPESASASASTAGASRSPGDLAVPLSGCAHASTFAGAVSCGWDVMTIEHYIFRHERGWLWTLEQFVGVPGITETEAGRSLVEDLAAAEYKELNKGLGGFIGSSARNPSFTREDLERNFAHQDTLWHIDRLVEGIAIVEKEIGVLPLWHCPAYCDARPKGPFTAIHRRPTEEAYMMVDMGLYGEANAPGFRFRSCMRRVQRASDLATAFGYVYLSREEMAETFDMAMYERVRARYGAAAGFHDFSSKVCMYDDSKPDLGKYPMWRLKRAGLETPVYVALGAVAVVAAAGVLMAVSGDVRQTVHKALSSAATGVRQLLGV
jgi:FAD/FMN-containing dehydrogenase